MLYSKRRLLLDAAICLVAVLFVLAGYRRGLILELGSVAGFFAGLAAASALWYPAALALHRVIDNQVAAAVAGFVGVFVVAYVACVFLASLLRGLLRLILLGWLDRIGGAALGLIKAAFVLELGLILVTHLPAGQAGRFTSGARVAPWLEGQRPLVGAVLAPLTARLPLVGGFL